MKYYAINLYNGKMREISRDEFLSRKIGMGCGIKGDSDGITTWQGKEEILVLIESK